MKQKLIIITGMIVLFLSISISSHAYDSVTFNLNKASLSQDWWQGGYWYSAKNLPNGTFFELIFPQNNKSTVKDNYSRLQSSDEIELLQSNAKIASVTFNIVGGNKQSCYTQFTATTSIPSWYYREQELGSESFNNDIQTALGNTDKTPYSYTFTFNSLKAASAMYWQFNCSKGNACLYIESITINYLTGKKEEPSPFKWEETNNNTYHVQKDNTTQTYNLEIPYFSSVSNLSLYTDPGDLIQYNIDKDNIIKDPNDSYQIIPVKITTSTNKTGTAAVYASLEEDNNYNAKAAAPLTIAVTADNNKQSYLYELTQDKDTIYVGDTLNFTSRFRNASDGTDANKDLGFYTFNNDITSASGITMTDYDTANHKGSITANRAGNYVVSFTGIPDDTTKYNRTSAKITFTALNKITPTIIARNTAEGYLVNKTYGMTGIPVFTVERGNENITSLYDLSYSFTKGNTEASYDVANNELTTGSVTGTARLKVTATPKNKNYEIVSKTFDFYIVKSITPTVTISPASATVLVNKKTTMPNITVSYNGTTLSNSSYTITQDNTLSSINSSRDSLSAGNSTGSTTYTFNVTPVGSKGDTNNYTSNIVKTFTLNIISGVIPVLSLSSSDVSALTGGAADFEEPSLTITNQEGADISSHYKLSYSSNNPNIASVNNSTGEVTTGYTAGTAVITINASSNNSYYASATTTYTINVASHSRSTYDYAVANYYYNKMYFTGAGTIMGGSSITSVPGITITFGSSSDTWRVYNVRWESGNGYYNYYNDGSNLIAQADNITGEYDNYKNAVLDNRGIPKAGTFYAFTPKVNGFLTVDGSFFDNQHIKLVSWQNNKLITDSIINSFNKYGEIQFPHALKAGYTYYLYNAGGTVTYPFQFHGFYFAPAFITGDSNTEPITTGIAYTKGNNFAYTPKIIYKTTEGVNLYCADNNIASVNSDGTLDVKSNGTTTIYAYIYNKDKSRYSYASYNLEASNVSYYMLGMDTATTASVGKTITDYDKDAIITYGGWIDPNSNNNVRDAWSDINNDISEGGLDGFTYTSSGLNEALDERYSYFVSSRPSPFNLPCRGAFLKIEPKTDGHITMYILQQGCENSTNKNVTWRPYYVVDEEGNIITMDSNVPPMSNHTLSYDADDIDMSSLSSDQYSSLKANWEALGNVQKVIAANDGGYVVPETGMVKYTFSVKRGKTYFIFGNHATMGFSGYLFRNNTYNKNYVNYDYRSNTNDVTSANNVDVLLKRSLISGQWNPIILPFSTTESQFRSIFGNDAMILHIDSISNQILYATRHYYQYIIGGKPCLVFIPENKIFRNNTLTFDNVTIDKPEPDNINCGDYTFTGLYDYKKIGSYNYVYRYGKPDNTNITDSAMYLVRIPEGNSILVPAFSAYFQVNATTPVEAASKSIGADLMETLPDYNTIRPDNTTTTGIQTIKINISNDIKDTGNEDYRKTFGNNIYNMNGQSVSSGISNQQKLPKGVYIYKGKKIIIQ